jgi:hypothetical protein
MQPIVAPEETTEGSSVTGPRIRCPRCDWRPQPVDLWSCTCGHMWHTFDTGGVCPACLLQWMETQCFACHRFSAHSDWYVYE